MVIERLKTLVSKSQAIKQADIDRLKAMPDDQRDKDLQSLLYEVAFRNAATFVHDELKKSGLFSGLDRDHFFQEILIMNFWMMDKVFSKTSKDLAEKMHHHYFGSLPDIAERTMVLSKKFKTYYAAWDDYTGHHHEFGIKVGDALFGEGSGYPERQISFWIISYADDSIKKYKKIRKTLREAGIFQEA
jgi:hypothetical protein